MVSSGFNPISAGAVLQHLLLGFTLGGHTSCYVGGLSELCPKCV